MRPAQDSPLLVDVLDLPAAMFTRIDRRAQEARALLARDVDRAAVVRAAVATWFTDAEERPLDIVHQSIRASLQANCALQRLRQRWPPEMAAHLDRIATTAARALGREVSRSAVVRAALVFWLADAEERPAMIVARAIDAAIVKHSGKAPV